MNNNSSSKNGSIHLYNPKKEGLGCYDIHYVNAYKKRDKRKAQQSIKNIERKAA